MHLGHCAIRFKTILTLWLVAIALGLLGCSASSAAKTDLPPVVKPTSQSVTVASAPESTRAALPPIVTVVPPTTIPTILPATPVPPTPVLAKPAINPAPPPANPVVQPVPQPVIPFTESDLYIHLPPQASRNQPLRVALVLHGMGAKGDAFAKALAGETDRYSWVIVAPNLPYRDYMEPKILMEDDIKITKMLIDTLNALPARLNLSLQPRALVFGFSRGAQLAHRFAMMYPDRVESVATVAAGTYTLPVENAGAQLLPFPFGIGDLDKLIGHAFDWNNFKKVSFWVGVGERDNQARDVPRQFDPYQGANRVDRARAFERALRSIGVDVQLMIFPNAGHEVTSEMRRGATEFLNDCERKNLPLPNNAQ